VRDPAIFGSVGNQSKESSGLALVKKLDMAKVKDSQDFHEEFCSREQEYSDSWRAGL
jgi:hypothetical protein